MGGNVRETRDRAPSAHLARRLFFLGGMSFTVVMNRVQTDFMQMPELELTLGQAVRMWTLGLDDCRCVIDALVDSGFLAWTPRRTIVRQGRPGAMRLRSQASDISVHGGGWSDNSVLTA
jgi:hypothetical protein